MAPELTIEERERALDNMAKEQIAAEKKKKNVEAFLNKEGLTDTQRELRKTVYDEYIVDKIASNPEIAQNISTIEDFYGVGLTVVEAKREAAKAKASSTTAPNPAATPPGNTPPNTPRPAAAADPNAKPETPASIGEAIAKSGLSLAKRRALAATARLIEGVEVDDVKS